MPNHVENRLVIKPREDDQNKLQEVLNYIKGDAGSSIDFNKILPMPEELDIENSSDGAIGRDVLLSQYGGAISPSTLQHFNDLPDERRNRILEIGAKYITNKAKYGFETWWGWNRANWGTKWNAYETKTEGNAVWFQTAWNGVTNLMTELSKKFPDVLFEYAYADEDTGYNVGIGTICNGCCKIDHPKGGTKEAYEIAFLLRPDYRAFYELVDGEYKYKEEL